MRTTSMAVLLCCTLVGSQFSLHAAERFVSLSGGHVPPFTDWAGAATNIQDAIDVSTDGDLIWVTNGVYASGGKVMAGDLTNRVALDRVLTVQSVNGPYVTVIKGQHDPLNMTGPGAVRCAWVTNGATLRGFTLRGGATRTAGTTDAGAGGGIFCSGTNAVISECCISRNYAFAFGGGVYQGWLKNCLVTDNTIVPLFTASGSGGGVFLSRVESSAILRNTASSGGGAARASLTNCTVTGNFGTSVGGTHQSTHVNCVVYHNRGPAGPSVNSSGGIFFYSCTTPMPPGPAGNIIADPGLLPDGMHLTVNSPCRGAGVSSGVDGLDIDGQTWGAPPSMGCDEWHPEPAAGQPTIRLIPGSGLLAMEAVAAGQSPVSLWWYKDGELITANSRYSGVNSPTLTIRRYDATDAGAYYLVASNEFGTVTSPSAHLVIHCVNADNSGPAAPYTNWATAAATIQDAIDAAEDGHVVLVTNGIYATGGRTMAGDLGNRVALNKAIVVDSFNGPAATIIQGGGVTNGPSALRCAWVGAGATLSGFTLKGGATRTTGDFSSLQSGGGAWCANSNNAVVANCWVSGNFAARDGGGVFQGVVNNCAVLANSATQGGGTSGSTVSHCTVVSNTAAYSGCGILGGSAINSIVYYNSSKYAPGNHSAAALTYSCSTPLPSGSGNISAEPLLLADGVHLGNESPCRGAGTNAGFAGMDISGLPWGDPPSMGCAEWRGEATVTDPILEFSTDPAGFVLRSAAAGVEPVTCRWFRDGLPLENDGHYLSADTPVLTVTRLDSSHAGTYHLVASNEFGMATSAVVQVRMRYVDQAGSSPVAPYLSWETAATNIQDAIDAASAGDLILVEAGLFNTGGRVMEGDLTNRVVIDKAVMVHAVNGPRLTTIAGTLFTTNGTGAVRCAWLTNGAVLSGFTIRDGATRQLYNSPQSWGGGVYAETNAALTGCLILDNMAYERGGAVYGGIVVNSTLTRNTVVNISSSGGSVTIGGAGAYRSTLKNCWLTDNTSYGSGGGAMSSRLENCLLRGNSSIMSGAGAYEGSLVHCTIVNNIAGGYGAYGSAVANAALTNCIVYNNDLRPFTGVPTNYSNCTLANSCSTPLPPGVGNIDADPQFLADGFHLSATSPCRSAGTGAVSTGADLDGQMWAEPPSMGCDEWRPEPALPGNVQFYFSRNPRVFNLTALAVGQEPIAFWWLKDSAALEASNGYSGIHDSTLRVAGFGPDHAGAYAVIASNAFGMATSAVAQVVVHCVDAAASSPAPPFSSWATAAGNIQDAIDAAAPGEIVLVTNGVYSAGGKVMVGDLLNRAALSKPLLVASVNGPDTTIIQGQKDSGDTGPEAVRCAWLANDAVLSGFTLRDGATRTGGGTHLGNGAGAWCLSTNASIVDCVIEQNIAAEYGGGSHFGRLERCIVRNNHCNTGGGGVAGSLVLNSFISSNSVFAYSGEGGGGAYRGTLVNCTVTLNSAGKGGGIFFGTVANSIVRFNDLSLSWPPKPDWYSTQFSYSCTTPLPGGAGNISADPELLSGIYQMSSSPCRGAGSAAFVSGTDIEGEPWLDPPSMGCDEFHEENMRGPLLVQVSSWSTNLTVDREAGFWSQVTGRASRAEWAFGDGSVINDISTLGVRHAWTNPGVYTVTFTAFNADYPGGVSTELAVEVQPLVVPVLEYSSASTNAFTMTFFGQVGVFYTLKSTTNLSPPVLWSTARSYVGDGEPIEFTDTQVSNSAARFYRLEAF